MSSPEEREFDREEHLEREIAEIELDEIHADETRHDFDLFTPGSIDSIPWPTAISVRPREVKVKA